MGMATRTYESGSSLLEAVIALFLMTTIMILSFQLFHSASYHQSDSEDRLVAISLASAKIAELRIAAAEIEQFRNSLLSFRGVDSDRSHPKFVVTVETSDYGEGPLYSPSSSHESLFRASPVNGLFPSVTDDRRSMVHSTLTATVKVSWSKDRGQPVSLTTLLREPPRIVERVEIAQNGSSTLSYGESVEFAAQVWDSSGSQIDDAVLSWTVVPVSGYGTVYQTRDGRRAALRYVDIDFNGLEFQPPPGSCRLKAVAKIEGREVEALTNLIELGP